MARTRANKGHGVNPYEPPSDESQLDRIERKIDKLNGEFLTVLILGAGFGAAVLILLEVLRVNGWKF
jgi:hypothetical protein